MKAFAYILIVSLALMGLNRFMHGMENPRAEDAISRHMECCADEDECGADEATPDQDSDHQCPPGCDCGCCFHLTAIHYQFMSLPGADMETYHYGQHQDNYYFDFFIPLFQPPRLG
jgi:hypothetical protein